MPLSKQGACASSCAFSPVSAARTRRKKKQEADSKKKGEYSNPFLPPEPDLTVSDISDTHLAVLNKFNVVEHHLLIITRGFEEQETLLTPKDFEALWLCMAEFDGLGFYNGGREAGASQRHKHLQMVPLPLTPAGSAVPIEPMLASVRGQSGIFSIPGFSFLHSFTWLNPEIVRDPAAAARTTFGLYAEMLRKLGMQAPDQSRLVLQSEPYCFLVTREWMLLVPRTREFFEGISLNCLAYAGSFFVRDQSQLERLKSYGPLKALADVAKPR